VGRAVAYLDGLSTGAGRFEQTDARGGVTRGDFYLQRPGRARFDYDPPSGVSVASDGRQVSQVDRRLKTMRSYPLGMTPLAIFLAKDIRLDQKAKVVRVIRGETGFTIVARDGGQHMRGEIALEFSEAPMALVGWTLTDGRGGRVHIKLADFAPSQARPEGFFRLADPRDQPADTTPR
jgi:outer membrane lipoprotein-sorting protein